MTIDSTSYFERHDGCLVGFGYEDENDITNRINQIPDFIGVENFFEDGILYVSNNHYCNILEHDFRGHRTKDEIGFWKLLKIKKP